jgi:hypothetical protein
MQDAIKQYLEVRQKLIDTKAELIAKLEAIDQLLSNTGNLDKVNDKATGAKPKGKPGRKPGRKPNKVAGSPSASKSSTRSRSPRQANKLSVREVVSRALSQGGSLDRKAIMESIKELGYRFTTSNPLNSLNASLYQLAKRGIISKSGKLYSLASSGSEAAKPTKPKAVKAAKPKTAKPKAAKAKAAKAKKA